MTWEYVCQGFNYFSPKTLRVIKSNFITICTFSKTLSHHPPGTNLGLFVGNTPLALLCTKYRGCSGSDSVYSVPYTSHNVVCLNCVIISNSVQLMFSWQNHKYKNQSRFVAISCPFKIIWINPIVFSFMGAFLESIHLNRNFSCYKLQ